MAREDLRPEGLSPRESDPVLRAAGAMGVATLLSRVLGLAREQVLAILFGAGHATDAFYVAFRLPNLLRNLFAEGSMSAALVPAFTRVRRESGDARAWRTAGLVFRVLAVGVGLLALLGVWLAPWLVSVYAGSYREVPGKLPLVVLLTQVMFPFFPLVAVAAALMAVLNACGRFFVPAFASALFNLASIVSGVILARIMPRYGYAPIVGMAWGVVIGGAVQALCQLPSLYRVGYRWPAREPGWPKWTEDPELRRVMAMMVPGTVGLAATQVSVLVNTMLATSQAPGAVSWLNYAFRLMQFPIGIFGVSLATAALPAISRQWVEGDRAAAARTLSRSLRHMLAVNLPAAAGLVFLGYPIIELLFGYGRFTEDDVRSTAFALAAYSLGLPAYSAVKVLVPACYAMGQTRVAVLSSVCSVLVGIALNLLLIGPFGHVGLALGTSLAAILNGGILLGALSRVLVRSGTGLDFQALLKSLARQVAASLLMGGVCFLTWRHGEGLVSDESLASGLGHAGIALIRAFKVGIYLVEGLVVLLLVSRLFGSRETADALDLFAKKLKNKLSRPGN